MVRAIKRKPTATEAARKKEKKKEFNFRLFTIVVLGLMVLGWTVGSYIGLGPQQDEPLVQEPVEPEFGIGTLMGAQKAQVGQVSDNHAVFGQLEVPGDLKERLAGDLYLLDKGASQLILTRSAKEQIEEAAAGSYIVYTIASCGDFDCLLDDQALSQVSGNSTKTLSFDVYSLNMTSAFTKTGNVGFPSS